MENQSNISNIFTVLARWILAFGGLLYFTGFLVVLTYSEKLGLREAGTVFFKIKYIEVGFLCLVLPIIIISSAYSMFILRSTSMLGREKNRHNDSNSTNSNNIKLYPPSIILVFNLLFVFYSILMFSPPGFIREQRPLAIPAIFVSTVIGLLLIQKASEWIKPELSDKFHIISRWILCIFIVIGLNIYTFIGIHDRLAEIFFSRGLYYLVFIGFIGFLIIRAHNRAIGIEPSAKSAVWIIVISIIILLYYLMVLSFAYSIYPYIPVSRGGGNYEKTPLISIEADNLFMQSNKNNTSFLKHVILLKETRDALFVASPESGGGPVLWRRRNRPDILVIPKSHILKYSFHAERNIKKR